MLTTQRTTSASTSGGTNHDEDYDHDHTEHVRDIHALTPPPPPQPQQQPRGRWETGSHGSTYSMSMASEGGSSENFTTMSREFNALVLAGSTVGNTSGNNHTSDSSDVHEGTNLLSRIREDDLAEETNPLAIVPDTSHLNQETSSRRTESGLVGVGVGGRGGEVSVQRVKKEEVESKISAWQNAKIAKINNRFKREDAVIHGWESEQVQKANSWMKKVERKLEEKRAKALEKMQNDIAKSHRKAEERRASSESKRGTKVARVLEVANLMRAVGRAPSKKSFF